MVVVESPNKIFSFEAKKKMGNPTYYGERNSGLCFYGREYIEASPFQYGIRIYGGFLYGENLSFEGIYQTRPRPKGRIAVRMKFYVPPETSARIANPRRTTFADGVSAWQALSTVQKEFYRLKSMGKHMSGYNVFLHEYLISH